MERRVAVVPKSGKRERMLENYQVSHTTLIQRLVHQHIPANTTH